MLEETSPSCPDAQRVHWVSIGRNVKKSQLFYCARWRLAALNTTRGIATLQIHPKTQTCVLGGKE